MIREIVKIDEEKCNGCGVCVPNCHEGALQIIDGKARLISELMCDGLGACLGHCPEGAIEIEKREADEYDEIVVIQQMIPKGKNTLIAHLKHLKEHDEHVFLKQAVEYLRANEAQIGLNVSEITREVHSHSAHQHQQAESGGCGGGCPGSAPVSFAPQGLRMAPEATGAIRSELQQWPVQMHLINPAAGYFQGQDMVLAADCAAFSHGDFHRTFLRGKKLVIACPKLDSGKEIYVEKIRRLIDESKINTLTVIMMEVPCCGGLSQLVRIAQQQASRRIPVKEVIISIQGEILSEDWV